MRRLTFACTELPSTIGNLKALEALWVMNNKLAGTRFCIPRTTSYPADIFACSLARDFWPAHCHDLLRSGGQQVGRYVLGLLPGLCLTLFCTELPSTIGGLESLQNLNLEGNALTGTYSFYYQHYVRPR